MPIPCQSWFDKAAAIAAFHISADGGEDGRVHGGAGGGGGPEEVLEAAGSARAGDVPASHALEVGWAAYASAAASAPPPASMLFPRAGEA